MAKTKWRVRIPPPKSERMKGSGVLVVQRNDGQEGTYYDRYEIGPEVTDTTFEIDDCYEWRGATSVLGGDDFEVYIRYANSTGTREESAWLVPEKVKGHDPGGEKEGGD